MMKSTPLGVGGGLAGAMAAASAIAPALGHQQEGDYNRRCIYCMPQPVGSPPPGGRAHGMGAGGSPCQIGRNSGVSPPGQTGRGYRLRPIWVGQRGDTRASSAFGKDGHQADGACADTAQKTREVYRPTLEPPSAAVLGWRSG